MWEAYIVKRGSLNIGLRLEQGFALLATLIRQAMGDKNAQMADHLPHFEKPELSLEEAMKLWN